MEAFPVSHGTLECYGYKFTTPDRTIVITGDTAPLDLVAEKSKGCDILLHEVEYAAGISCREPKWQKYHREVHTLSTDLAGVAKKANPKLLVTYHRIYHMNVQDNHVRFGMSPETLSIFIYPTGRFYHTLRYFRTVFSVSACDLPQDAEENTQKQPVMKTIYFFDINLLRTYNHSITTLAKQQDFLLFVVTGT